jgi:pimeloyl-ACP methyl ester carboxylesterase
MMDHAHTSTPGTMTTAYARRPISAFIVAAILCGCQTVQTTNPGVLRASATELERAPESPAPERPQTPQPPFPYASHNVTVWNASARLGLTCTLLIPHGGGPFSVVAFLSGSGPQDRDETLMAHKPFLVIADYLGRRGIASLRCDDRGVGGSQGSVAQATIADTAADAAAAVRFLAMQPDIDNNYIGLIGHSEGGLVAARTAATMDEVDFIVLLAAAGVRLDQLLLRQQQDLLKARGLSAPLVAEVSNQVAAELELAKDDSLSQEELADRLERRAERLDEIFTDRELAKLRVTEERTERGIRLLTTPWFRSLVRERPSEYLERLDVPALALFGAKDLQVAPHVNAAAVRSALEAAPTECHVVHVLPELNHLFQHAKTGAVSEYGKITETFAPEVLEMIAGWIAQLQDDGWHARERGRSDEGSQLRNCGLPRPCTIVPRTAVGPEYAPVCSLRAEPRHHENPSTVGDEARTRGAGAAALAFVASRATWIDGRYVGLEKWRGSLAPDFSCSTGSRKAALRIAAASLEDQRKQSDHDEQAD